MSAQFSLPGTERIAMAEGIRVLLIDDDADFIQFNSIILNAGGFQVITASSYGEGLDKAAIERPAVVVMNVIVENSDQGFSLARDIHKELGDSVPVIMLSSVETDTGYTFKPEDHPDYFPVHRFIEKPVSPTRLIEEINKAIS